MRITLELSMYPLHVDYEPAILDFIAHLNAQQGLHVRVNALSTQVQGEMAEVFEAVQGGAAHFFGSGSKGAFVMKMLPGDIELDYTHQA